MTPVSVVMPAHDEERTIARSLGGLLSDAAPGEFEVIVVCNGCTDRTAETARHACPDATVLEIPVASKIAALNEGERHATRFPRLYIDADVEMGTAAARAVADALASGDALCASAQVYYDCSESSWPVRRYFDIWQRLPHFASGPIGGAYGLSRSGRERFGPFPDVIADDQFVTQQFDRSERVVLDSHTFRVRPPRDLRSLVRTRTRVYRGNLQLAASQPTRQAPVGGAGRSLARLCRSPRDWLGVAIYVSISAVAKLRARRTGPAWERDESTRTGPTGPTDAAGSPRVGYVVAYYPAVSHTFISREVRGLRRMGADVRTFSVHRADVAGLLSPDDIEEFSATTSLRPVSGKDFLRVQSRVAVRHPAAYLATLLEALAASPKGLRARLWQLFYFAEAVLLFDRCDRDGISRLHAHFANVAADLCWLATSLGRRADPAGDWSWSFTMHGPTEWFAPERFNLARKADRADRIICISRFCRSELQKILPEASWGKLHVVHCGVDTKVLSWVDRRARPDGPTEILFVGRLTAEKGQAVLIDAVARLLADGTPVRLTLAGDGPTRRALEAKVERLGVAGAVEFLGAVGQPDLLKCFERADVFCLPSFAEGLPVVLMEAMARGLPVVTTPVAGIPELVVDGVNGLLVPAGRADLVAVALGRLAGDAALRSALGLAGRQAVEAEFEIDGCAARVGKALGVI
jgi:glycosyltransferase involved in cell wall biosynthesis